MAETSGTATTTAKSAKDVKTNTRKQVMFLLGIGSWDGFEATKSAKDVSGNGDWNMLILQDRDGHKTPNGAMNRPVADSHPKEEFSIEPLYAHLFLSLFVLVLMFEGRLNAKTRKAPCPPQEKTQSGIHGIFANGCSIPRVMGYKSSYQRKTGSKSCSDGSGAC
jgi:hypothetical protein